MFFSLISFIHFKFPMLRGQNLSNKHADILGSQFGSPPLCSVSVSIKPWKHVFPSTRLCSHNFPSVSPGLGSPPALLPRKLTAGSPQKCPPRKEKEKHRPKPPIFGFHVHFPGGTNTVLGCSSCFFDDPFCILLNHILLQAPLKTAKK